MYRDTFSGRWDQFRSDSKREWDKLTDEDLDQIKGNMEESVKLVQQKYAYTSDQAQQEVTRFMKSHDGKMVKIAGRLPGDVDNEVRQHPWAALATAIGFGIVLGFLVKPSHVGVAERPTLR